MGQCRGLRQVLVPACDGIDDPFVLAERFHAYPAVLLGPEQMQMRMQAQQTLLDQPITGGRRDQVVELRVERCELGIRRRSVADLTALAHPVVDFVQLGQVFLGAVFGRAFGGVRLEHHADVEQSLEIGTGQFRRRTVSAEVGLDHETFGLESDQRDLFYAGGGRSGRIRAVRKPRRR